MPVNHVNLTVGTTPTILCTIATGHPYTQVLIYNNDNNPIYIGDSAITVTAGNNQGFPVAKNVPMSFYMHSNDTLYGISQFGTTTGAVTVMYSDM